MIGLKRGTVALVPHSEKWHVLAAETADLLKEVMGNIALDVQHVGSTSIRGICAKPIIDLAVAVKKLDDLFLLIPKLEQRGIVYRKQDVTGQMLFVMGDFDADTRTHHIHMVPADSQDWQNYLNFRDYLNAKTEKAMEYEALKKQLLLQFADDRNGYTNGKKELINRLLMEAAKWRKLR